MFYFTCNESKIYESFTFWNKLQEKNELFHDILIYWDAPVSIKILQAGTVQVKIYRSFTLAQNKHEINIQLNVPQEAILSWTKMLHIRMSKYVNNLNSHFICSQKRSWSIQFFVNNVQELNWNL